MTSNPSIFEKAIGHGTDYDASLRAAEAEDDHDANALSSGWRSRTSSMPPPSCGPSTIGPMGVTGS